MKQFILLVALIIILVNTINSTAAYIIKENSKDDCYLVVDDLMKELNKQYKENDYLFKRINEIYLEMGEYMQIKNKLEEEKNNDIISIEPKCIKD